MKRILIFLVVFFLLFFTAQRSFASDNFDTSYDVTYAVKNTGFTNVSLRAVLTNKSGQSYATSYKIHLGFTDIQNVKASDPNGAIIPIVKSEDGGSVISVDFNAKVVGKGNILPFIITFDTQDVSKKLGNIWEINIPGITHEDDFTDFAVHLRVPKEFGKPIYIKPAVVGLDASNLDFTKEQLGTSGISVAYGSYQIYEFNLKYHLKNRNLFPIQTEIALPPNTNYQEVYIESIDKKPQNVTIDSDGNWLAQYSLLPSERKDITVSGKVRILLYPKEEIQTEKELNTYLKEQTFWEAQNSNIQELANRLKTPEAIYKYVVESLTYDFSRVTQNKDRIGAVSILQYPDSAVCLEFTDLFIALARAAGIPAREVDGYAYTENTKQRPLSLVKDVLHAWPEYYDKNQKRWVMVDPTWGNTTGGTDYFHTFDFDHIAFVVKGKDSQYPVTAGGYKIVGEENVKDVEISFAKSDWNTLPTYDLVSHVSPNLIAGFPVKGYITIINSGNVFVPKQQLFVTSDFLSPSTQTLLTSDIPPFGKTDVYFSFYKTGFLTNRDSVITITVNDKTLHQKVVINPIFLTKWGVIGGFVIAVLGIGIYIIASRAWNLLISKQ